MNTIDIIEFSESLKDCFKRLNTEWLEKYFVILPSDELVLSNPVESVINKGGFIYFAKADNKIVGTFALIKVDENTYEIAKMAVTEQYQNRGIGKKLMEFAIQKAKDMNVGRIILYSHTDLNVAVKMYSKFGFKSIPKTDFHNARANIKMDLLLK